MKLLYQTLVVWPGISALVVGIMFSFSPVVKANPRHPKHTSVGKKHPLAATADCLPTERTCDSVHNPTSARTIRTRTSIPWKHLDLRPRWREHNKVAQLPPPKIEIGKEYQLPPEPPRLPQRTLLQVYSMAKHHNVDLKILKQQLILAEIAQSQAWVPLRPNLNLSATYTRNQVEVLFNTGPNTQAIITPKNRFDLNVQMNWTFLNLRAIPQIQWAALNQKFVGKTVEQTRRELFFSIVQTYYNVVLAEGTFKIARESWYNALQHLEIATARQQAGMSTDLAKMQAQLDVARAQQTWVQARNAVRNIKLTLALLLGHATFPYQVERPKAPQLPQGKIERWLDLAQQERTELKAKKLAWEMAQKQQLQAWMAYFPTASLTGGVNVTNATGFAGQDAQWTLGVSLQWALYSGGTRSLSVRENYANTYKVALEYRKEQQRIENEVRQAYLDLQNADIAVEIAFRNVDLARKTYQLRQQSYRAGMSTPLAVSDANTQLLSAEINYLREILNRDLSILRLQRAVGLFQVK